MAAVLLYHVETIDRVNQHCCEYKSDYPYGDSGLHLREMKTIFPSPAVNLAKAGVPCVLSYDLSKKQYVESITFNHYGELVKELKEYRLDNGTCEHDMEFNMCVNNVVPVFHGSSWRTQRGIAGCLCGEPITPDAIKYGKRHALIQILES